MTRTKSQGKESPERLPGRLLLFGEWEANRREAAGSRNSARAPDFRQFLASQPRTSWGTGERCWGQGLITCRIGASALIAAQGLGTTRRLLRWFPWRHCNLQATCLTNQTHNTVGWRLCGDCTAIKIVCFGKSRFVPPPPTLSASASTAFPYWCTLLQESKTVGNCIWSRYFSW